METCMTCDKQFDPMLGWVKDGGNVLCCDCGTARIAELEAIASIDPDALRKLLRYAPDAGLTEAEYDAMFRMLGRLEQAAKGGE